MHIDYKKLKLRAVWLLVAFTFLCLSPAKAETVTEVNINNYTGNTYEITTAGNYKITGNGETSKNIKVNVNGAVNITIENVNINMSSVCAFEIQKGTVNLTLKGDNRLTSGSYCAGIRVPEQTTLTISGDNSASLNATGGEDATGIGGNMSQSMGTVTIQGGNITANGGTNAAGIGIGAAKGGGTGSINISGGYVKAFAGGGSNQGALGCSGGANGNIKITISGGIVYARGGTYSYGGSGDINTNGTIIISNALIDFDTNKSYAISNSIEFNAQNGSNKDQGKVHGDYTFTQDYEIPKGKTLTVDNETSITVNSEITLINNGTINNNGTIKNNGTINGNIDGSGKVMKPFDTVTIETVSNKEYTGSAITPEITITDGDYTLVKDNDYTLSYEDNTDAGKAKITITPKGDRYYGDAVEKEFTITKKEVTVTLQSAVSKVYDGTTTINSASLALNNVIEGDQSSVTLNNTSYTFTFSSSNVADEITINANPTLALAGDKAQNYTLKIPDLKGKITAKELTVTPTAGQSIYPEEAGTYKPVFTSTGAISDETAAFTGKLAWDSNSKAFTVGTLTLEDNGSFKKTNYELKLAGEPGAIEIKTEELSATSPVPSGENSWHTGDITLTAPDGFKINANTLSRKAEDWATSIVITEEGNYDYSYSLLRDGQTTPVEKTFHVQLDKTPPVLTFITDNLGYTLTFGDGANGSGIAKLLVDDQEVTLAADATTYSNTSTAGLHKASVLDKAGHESKVEFTLKEKENDTPPYEPPYEPSVETYTVILPSVEGAATDPAAGEYEVEAWGSFRFYLTLDKGYDQSEPVVTTDRGETITPRSSDGAYIVKYVRTDMEIFINGIVKNPDPVANEKIETGRPKIWKTGNELHIQAVTDEPGYIYTPDGKLQTVCHLIAGEVETVRLPDGIYFVRVGKERFKIVL